MVDLASDFLDRNTPIFRLQTDFKVERVSSFWKFVIYLFIFVNFLIEWSKDFTVQFLPFYLILALLNINSEKKVL